MTNNSPAVAGTDGAPVDDSLAAERVVTHIERLIQAGQLKPGDRLPPERELALQIKVSRPSVRAGLRSLAAVGIVEARHGAGSFITSGPPKLSTGPLSLMAALHGFTRDDMFDARRVLEVAAAALAAERATGDNLATMSEEVAGMFASLQEPQAVRVHDVRFPTSRTLDGSDALNVGDYSATYVIVETDGGVEGHGLTFTNGRGNELTVAAVHALRHHVIGLTLDEIKADMRSLYR